MNNKKRFGTIYKGNMDASKNKCDNCIKLQELIKNKDNEIKNLKNDIILLNEKSNILNNIIVDNVNVDDNIQPEDVSKDILIDQQKNKIEKLIDENNILINEIKIERKKDIQIKETEEYKKLEMELKDIKDDYIKIQNNNEKDEKISELQNDVDELKNKLINTKEVDEKEIETKYKKMYEDKLKEVNKNKSIPSPTSSKDIKEEISMASDSRTRFQNKKLPILERCNVKPYKYNDKLKNNKKAMQVLEFIDSEHKVMVRFNSHIAEKADEDDNTLWKEIFQHKVDNGLLSNSPSTKSNYKYQVLRCKELYNLYEENLSRFQIYVNYLGRMTEKEWEQYLIEFDKLYKYTIDENLLCKHKYKNGKYCNRLNCKIKHKENK
jgi:hypothetical protein